jgi:hypothetical protein
LNARAQVGAFAVETISISLLQALIAAFGYLIRHDSENLLKH